MVRLTMHEQRRLPALFMATVALAATLVVLPAGAATDTPVAEAQVPAVAEMAVERALEALEHLDAAPAGQPADPLEEIEHGRGVASWYGPGLHGRRTASGERFDQHALTAAHRSLPFGTEVRVEHLRTGRSVDVRINDRGPFAHRSRIIDLSMAAGRVLGLGRAAGLAPVRITILRRPRR